MKELINASLLVSGTAIVAGLIALPLMSVNFGIELSSAIIIFMIFIAYQSSMMTLDLNELNKQSAFIVVSLLSVIATSLVKIHASKTFEFSPIDCSKSEFFAFLLVIFTSFGVQNIYTIINSYCLIFLINLKKILDKLIKMCHTKIRWIEKRIDMMNEIKLVAVMGSVFMFLGCANAMDRINQLQSESSEWQLITKD